MSRPIQGDAITDALLRLIDDAKNPAKQALIARLRKHARVYAMEDGQLYQDLMEAVDLLGGDHA